MEKIVTVTESPKWEQIVIDRPRGRQDKEYKAIKVDGEKFTFTLESLKVANARSKRMGN